MPRRIRGRIIRILDSQTLIINLGLEQGINENSIFNILGKPEPILDPLTNEELGQVAVSRARVRASQVFDKFTIATTKWTEVTDSALFRWVLGTTKTIDGGALLVKNDDIKPWETTPIEVGDEIEVMVGEVGATLTTSPAEKNDDEASMSNGPETEENREPRPGR